MSKKAVVWIIVVAVLAAAAYWYIGSSSKGIGALPFGSRAGVPLSGQANQYSDIVPNAIIPTSTSQGAPIFDKAPAGTEFGGKNPPVTNKPVVTPAQPATTTTTSTYTPPVTDRPVVTPAPTTSTTTPR